MAAVAEWAAGKLLWSLTGFYRLRLSDSAQRSELKKFSQLILLRS